MRILSMKRRNYPIKRDEFGRSSGQQSFEFFNERYRTSLISIENLCTTLKNKVAEVKSSFKRFWGLHLVRGEATTLVPLNGHIVPPSVYVVAPEWFFNDGPATNISHLLAKEGQSFTKRMNFVPMGKVLYPHVWHMCKVTTFMCKVD